MILKNVQTQTEVQVQGHLQPQSQLPSMDIETIRQNPLM